MGMPPDAIEAQIAAEIERASFDVYADNWEVVRVFMALQTQWRIVVGAMSAPVYQGLDYASLPAVLDLMGVRGASRREQVFVCLRIMEDAAVGARNHHDE